VTARFCSSNKFVVNQNFCVQWKKLQIEELCNLYSPNIIPLPNKKTDDMSGVCGTYGGQESYKVYVRRTDGKGLLGRSKRRWDNNIKIRLKEVRWGGMD